MTREQKIDERLNQMPSLYRSTYRRAVRGKSLRAAINAQCLECCGWQRVEVAACTDTGCPLYAVRPYQDFSPDGREAGDSGVESTNAVERVSTGRIGGESSPGGAV